MSVPPEKVGLRFIDKSETPILEAWEKEERPYPWRREDFAHTLTSPIQTLIFEKDGNVLGFGVVQVIEDEAYLSNIMISKKVRRKGHGAQFLKRMMQWCFINGAKAFFLDVQKENDPAISLYKKVGFQIYEERKHFYPRGENALLMGYTFK